MQIAEVYITRTVDHRVKRKVIYDPLCGSQGVKGLTDSTLAFFNGCRKLRARKGRRDIISTIIFPNIIIDV